jgi:hypothetical protein
MAASVLGGLDSIRAVVNIKAIVAHRQALEDNFFAETTQKFSIEKGIALINVSANAMDLLWLANLDAEALSGKSNSSFNKKCTYQSKNCSLE